MIGLMGFLFCRDLGWETIAGELFCGNTSWQEPRGRKVMTLELQWGAAKERAKLFPGEREKAFSPNNRYICFGRAVYF
jgi:hypothetical protein